MSKFIDAKIDFVIMISPFYNAKENPLEISIYSYLIVMLIEKYFQF